MVHTGCTWSHYILVGRKARGVWEQQCEGHQWSKRMNSRNKSKIGKNSKSLFLKDIKPKIKSGRPDNKDMGKEWSMWRLILQWEREGQCMEKETETDCPDHWQAVDRKGESDDQGTAGNTGLNEQGSAGLGARRETWAGACVPTCVSCWEKHQVKERAAAETGRREVRACEVYVCVSSGTWHWVEGWEWHWMPLPDC